MMAFTDLTGLAGNALVLSAAATLLTTKFKMSVNFRLSLALAVFVGGLIPLGALSAAAYLRGAAGDLSIATLCLLVLFLANNLFNLRPVSPSCRYAFLGLIVIAALWLYPMALGAGYFDPYRAGFGDFVFVTILMLIALGALALRHGMTAVVILMAVAAWVVGWYESTNLWDYLLDPWVALYAMGALLRRFASGLRDLVALIR